ncbi:glycosyltransferase family 4 protein [Paraburkholderia adhaesiva]|uniref:glycosyltransferase family 4 protein n=1 Tax=Paraburkholderia adhaesiva TaxID=2883244 RepID=UPI001F3E4121|nr:glycosyltransferase family 1 protein [Paraburkholderia adhaesiva]
MSYQSTADVEPAIAGTIEYPRSVAVDLTPVLPGGDNGGAKIFVLELLRYLADIAPATQFILLTHAATHDELASLDRRNMKRRMIVGSADAPASRLRFAALATRVAPQIPARLIKLVSRLGYRANAALKRRGSNRLLRDLEVDLLFCPFTAPTYFERGIATVCTIYDLQFKTYPDFFTPADVAHRDQVFVDACARSTVLAAISDYSRQSAIRHGHLQPSRIRTIHLRIARRFASRTAPNLHVLDRLDLSSKRYLVYPANFWKHKNHEMLITAFGMACSTGKLGHDIKLVCTGAPGPRQEWLIAAARAMNLEERVLFPGYIPDGELGGLLAESSGVIFPSLYEGFGLPVIEAMAAGIPVACSNTTSLPEVAGDATLLFDPRVPGQISDAIVSLVNDEPLRARLIEAGARRVDEFSDTELMANQYWELFQYATANTTAHAT